MKSNLLPFGIIAVVGLFAAIIVFYIGVAQKADIEAEKENGGADVEDVVDLDNPEEIYAQTCAGCHGADLSSGYAPDLTSVGNNFSTEEISEIILNGVGQMPAQNLTQEESDALTDWLVNN